MSIYAGLDVSDKTPHICVVDTDGKVLRRDVVASDPEVLTKWLNRHCADLVCVVFETGPLSTFLYHDLAERGVSVECICVACQGCTFGAGQQERCSRRRGSCAARPHRLVQARSHEGVLHAHRSRRPCGSARS